MTDEQVAIIDAQINNLKRQLEITRKLIARDANDTSADHIYQYILGGYESLVAIRSSLITPCS
jgi:hypothetical protein